MRVRELLLEKIEQLGMEPKAFGMHSLWAGGATTAVRVGMAWPIACSKGMAFFRVILLVEE